MKKLAFAAMFVGAFGLVACGGGDDGGGINTGADASTGGPDAMGSNVCNPVTQAGCQAGEKCSQNITINNGTDFLGRTECGPDGTVAGGGACAFAMMDPMGGGLGFDNCVAGFLCLGSVCTEICDIDTNSCTNPEMNGCGAYSQRFDDLGEGVNVGLCSPKCDPVTQDCPTATDGCYLQFTDGLGSCAGIPAPAEMLTQGDTCYGPMAGTCFLNGCAKGFGANLPDAVCSFYCNPVNTHTAAPNDGNGDPAGIACNEDFAGARANGPGPTYDCIFLNNAYGDTDHLASNLGTCVVPAEPGNIDGVPWGPCSDFDLTQFEADVADLPEGGMLQMDYCTVNPDRCQFWCVDVNFSLTMMMERALPPNVKADLRKAGILRPSLR